MKSLPTTFRLPPDVDSLSEAIESENGLQLVADARLAISGLREYLGWLRTAPMPQDESVVAGALIDACDAALSVLDSVASSRSS